MKTTKKIVTYIFISLLTFELASGQHNKIAGNYNFDVECLGSELDGSLTLKVWGNGRNRIDAVDQAKKNALYVVIFKGITGNQSPCILKPLVTEVNAEEKHQTYFQHFFSEKSRTYLKFIAMRDASLGKTLFRKKVNNIRGVSYGVVVRVLIPELEKELIDNEIIRKQTQNNDR